MNKESILPFHSHFVFIVRHKSWCNVKGLPNNIWIITEVLYRNINGILCHVSHIVSWGTLWFSTLHTSEYTGSPQNTHQQGRIQTCCSTKHISCRNHPGWVPIFPAILPSSGWIPVERPHSRGVNASSSPIAPGRAQNAGLVERGGRLRSGFSTTSIHKHNQSRTN